MMLVITTDRPHDVVDALARVMSELGGVEKMTAAERARRGLGGGDTGVAYPYRGIDRIAGAAQPLLGRHGVVTVPVVETSRVDPLQINNKPWTETYVRVRWLVCGPGGVDDRLEAVTEGLGRDNSDKGFNKAMTGAYKNLLLRLLCIGDPADDTDGHTPEADDVTAPALIHPTTLQGFLDAAARAGLDDDGLAAVVATATHDRTRDPHEVFADELEELRRALAARSCSSTSSTSSTATGLLATAAQLATIEELEQQAELVPAHNDIVLAVLDRQVDDDGQLSRHEADRLIAVLGGIARGTTAMRYREDGTLELIAGTDDIAAISSSTNSGTR